MLTDRQIMRLQDERHVIEPYEPRHVQPCSYDVHLADEFYVTRRCGRGDAWIDASDGTLHCDVDSYVRRCDDAYMLSADGFVLASTIERVRVPDDVCVRLEGKSTLARLAVGIHDAGLIDPGFEGNITLELRNCAPLPVLLRRGQLIGQLTFHRLEEPVARPYGTNDRNHYQHQSGVTPAWMGPVEA